MSESMLFDADVLVGHYPFRQFAYPHLDPSAVKAHLQDRGVTRAVLASLHAVFYTEPQQGDDELFPKIVNDDFFVPAATINPSLHNWRDVLARSVEQFGCRMVRLVPNYHMYALTDPCVTEFMDVALEQNLLVCIVKRIEDERSHHPLMAVPAVENSQIVALAARYPQTLLVLSAYLNEISELAADCPHLVFDVAFAETMNTMARLTATVDPEQLLFSSHTPFFYTGAAIAKLDDWSTEEANQLAVRSQNLHALLEAHQ